MSINELIMDKIDIHNKICENYNKIKTLCDENGEYMKRISEIDSELDKICNHDYKKTNSGYNTDDSEWTCKLCNKKY